MQVSGFEQFLAHDFSCTALKQNIVRHNNGSLSCGFQNGIDMLHKVQLFIGTGCPEILSIVDEVFFLLFAFLVGESKSRLFAKRRIGQHIVHTVAGVCEKCITKGNRYIAVNITDVVEIQIHQSRFICGRYDFVAVEGFVFQKLFLLPVKGIVLRIGNERLRSEKKSSGTTTGVCDGFHRLRSDTFHHCMNQRTRGKILTCTALDIFRILLQQTFIDFTFDIGGHCHPFFVVNHLHYTVQNGGTADFITCAFEDFTENTALFAQFFQRGFILFLQFRTLEGVHVRPCVSGRNPCFFFVGRLGILIGHFQKDKVGKLFQIISVGNTVIPERIAHPPNL